MREDVMKKSVLIMAVFVSFLVVQCKTLTPIYWQKTMNDLEADKARLQKDLEPINATIATLDAAIAHHTKTRKAMWDVLMAAKGGKQPDTTRLKELATATGHRSKAYHKAPKRIRELIEKFETDLKKSLQGTSGQFIMTFTPGIGYHKGTYITEITRTDQFLKDLEEEKVKFVAQKEQLEAQIRDIDATIAKTKSQWQTTTQPSCFPADMQVALADGRTESIARIKKGDLLLTYNEETGTLTKSPVVGTLEAVENHHYLFNGRIKVTAMHRIFTDKGWKRAQDIDIGDKIRTADGRLEEIVATNFVPGDLQVYNLEVLQNHNFFVSPDGSDAYLVHNYGGGK
jgi:chaperonin cofactor prefoldin